jgi:hypothetical protein
MKKEVMKNFHLGEHQENQASSIVDRLYTEKFTKYDDFILNRYMAAALSGIVLHNDTVNNSVVRQILSTSEVAHHEKNLALQAIKYLRKFGSAEDVTLAIQTAKTSYGEVRNEALKTAIALAPVRTEVATGLINSDEVDFVRAGVGAVWD